MSRFTKGLYGFARPYYHTGTRQVDEIRPGFRVTQGLKRVRSTEYGGENEPEWGDFGEDESLAFLDSKVEYTHPTVLDEVAEENGNVTVFLTLMETACANF